jgi:hypothetical protein
MTQYYAVGGCKIYIGGVMTPDNGLVAADFTGQTWVQIKGWTQMGDIGGSAQLITDDVIDTMQTVKMKGTVNEGSMANVFVRDHADAGQIALIAAQKSRNHFAIRIEGDDKPAAGASPKNSFLYFTALVMGAPRTGGGANTSRKLSSTLEITSNIVETAPSAT